MISVISAVKGRHELTLESFNSIWEKCSDPDNVEHLLLCDYDDMKMRSLLEKYARDAEKENRRVMYDVVRYPNQRAYEMRMMHYHYWNRMALASRGNIIFGLCNDAIIDTNHYDIILQEKVELGKMAYGHGVFYLLCDDGYNNKEESRLADGKYNYSAYIILTSEAIQAFDGIAPNEISSVGADQYVSRVFHESLVPAVLDVTDCIHIKQFSVQNGNYPGDYVQDERPVEDTARPTWPYYTDLLNDKMYYHYRLQATILQSLLRHKSDHEEQELLAEHRMKSKMGIPLTISGKELFE